MALTTDTTSFIEQQQQNTKSSKSWFSGFFSHWHPLHKWSSSSTSSATPTTQLSTATSTTKSKNNNATLGPPPSSTSSSASSTYENPNTINTTSLQITVSPSSSSSRYPPTTAPWQWDDRQGLLFTERRQSQQTIGSILSDDQFSSSSCHGRNSEEKSRLGDLWSKARKRHPHYPRFRWPHRQTRQQQQQQQQSTSTGTGGSHPLHHPHRRAIPISIYSTPPQEERPTLATSYQDPPRPRRPSSLLPSSTPPSMMLKRHSITSLISGGGGGGGGGSCGGDPYYYTNNNNNNSRPGSVMYAATTTSQPESPRILFMKDGQLWDDDNDDMDDYCLENDIKNLHLPSSSPCHLHRWSLKHDLLKLALNGLIGCPMEENGGPSDKQVLQIGCGDGTWCVDVAMANPRWTVIGMEENGYDHCATTTTSTAIDANNDLYCQHHHHHHQQQQQQPCFGGLSGTHNMLKPKNMRLIRCAPSLLHALQQMPDHVFDLVDGRCLILAYSLDMYRQLVKECWRVCKIGGYVELIEMDMRMYHSKTPMSIGKTVHTLNSEGKLYI
ncbi:unnamed protein product [Absidia cylindrospora]